MQQHGDVLINPVLSLPENSRRLAPTNGRYILAEGEATGHAHAIQATPNVELHESGGTLYLRVMEEPVDLVHEEHRTQEIAPGIYEIGQVVEVDPFEGEIRTISD